MKKIVTLIFLALLWLLMSGLYKTLILSFGVVSVILVMYFTKRMAEKDGYELKSHLSIFNTVKYFGWLFLEVVKSNWEVSKILLSKTIEINQKFVETPASQKSDLAKVLFANSITLTPGTVTVETEDHSFIVHALNVTESSMAELRHMDEKVTLIERVVE
tara:strand:- start:52 stop:531 length:480 start_codon:yes stop_codon:yes gene_type:complete